MSYKSLFFWGIIFWIKILFLRYFFINNLGMNQLWHIWSYYFLLIMIARFVSRRLGVISFLEAIFLSIIWALIVLFLDSFFGKILYRSEIFQNFHYWFSYFVFSLGIFFLHKKRHIHIRKELQKGHH